MRAMQTLIGILIIASGLFLVPFNIWAIFQVFDHFGPTATVIAALLNATALAAFLSMLDSPRR